MTIQGILFDKDGTLLDFRATWIPAYLAVAKQAAKATAGAVSADHLLGLAGYDRARDWLDPRSLLASGTTREICELWASETGVTDIASTADNLRQAMDEFATRNAVPVGDGLASLFARLHGRGLKLGMATMDSEAMARIAAETMGLAEHLDFVCGFDSGHGLKPDSGMILAFCSVTGLAAEQVVVVGDTDRDMAMARAANAGLAVGVLTGATPRDELLPLADLVLDNVFAIEREVLEGVQSG